MPRTYNVRTSLPTTSVEMPGRRWISSPGFAAGVMAWGVAAGQWVLAHRSRWLTGPLPGVLRPLAVLGRWSLSFYMVHQPVLIAVLMLVK